MDTSDVRADKANRVTWVGFFVNLALVAFKLFAGVAGHSSAMVADAVHSLSDFATDVVVLVSFRIVRKPIDEDHDYGHGKFETLATAVIGGALLLVGFGIFWSGVKSIWLGLHGTKLHAPGVVALVAAVISIASKEWLYRYTVRVGRQINSQAVIANAWHHRSDAFSSVGTMLGIGGAILLGDRWRVLDPVAAIVVSAFIAKVALRISATSVRELMEGSLDEASESEILSLVSGIKGVVEPHGLRTRKIGNLIAIDLHVCVDKAISVVDGHNIATQVEAELRGKYGQETFVSIHIEPDTHTSKLAPDAPSSRS